MAFDPWRPVWRLLTSVRFAVFYISVLALFGLAGVVIPQVPEAMHGNNAAVATWLAQERKTFGPFTHPMIRLGLFQVFHARWFLFALGFLVVNITTCTWNRWAPTFRNVFRPRRRVPDSFFDRAHNRAVVVAVPPDALTPVLRRMRFSVRVDTEPAATYVFADRFAWAQLATFISHLALILFIAGGLVTRLTGFSTTILAGEGTTTPVFAVSNPNQLQVRIDEAIGRYNEKGNPLDFRTRLTIFKNGEQVAQGYTTVNDPLKYGGYRFGQSGFFPDGAEVQVRDLATGNTVLHETIPLDSTVAAPAVTVSDASGAVLLSDVIAPTDFVGQDLVGATGGALVELPGSGRTLWIGLTARDTRSWQLIAFDPQAGGTAAGQALVEQGAAAAVGGLTVRFDGVRALPSAVGVGVPGTVDGAKMLAELTPSADGAGALTLVSPDRPAITLAPGQSATAAGYEYTFVQKRPFAGIGVKRDNGAWFIWVATTMLIGGLAINFYVPRRRLWFKLTEDETKIAALAEKSGGFEGDVRRISMRLGVASPFPAIEDRV